MHERNAKLITPGNIEDDLKLLADCDWIIEVVLEELIAKLASFRDNPAGFVHWAFPWGEPDTLLEHAAIDPWQLDILWGVVNAAATGAISVPLGAMIANRWFARRTGFAMGLLTAANAAGQLIFLPLLYPLMLAFQWDPVWFGVILTLKVALGQFTPPLAVNLMVSCRIANVRMEDTVRWVGWMLFSMFLVMVAVIVWPELATALPKAMGY